MNIWRNLVRALKAEGVFMSHRLKPELLKERYESGLASVAFDSDGRIIAYCALWPTVWPGIVELGTVWVHKKYRGKYYNQQKISERIIVDCTNKLRKAGLRGIIVVGHKGAERLVIACGWQIDATGYCQSIRWALTGEDRPRPTGSTKASERTILVFYPE
ncbi:MAG: hypothetical protein Q8L21_02750 [Candidatus Komeilibacteria bacterium]|nr:hypothetical protein [Candidatus Komeilibacteria bacterium]